MAPKNKTLTKPKTTPRNKLTVWQKYDKFIVAGLLVCLSLLVMTLVLVWFYTNRALPGVSVASVDVGNMTAEELQTTIRGMKENTVTFVDGTETQTVPLSTLGVTVNVDATVNAILKARHSDHLFDNFMLWQVKKVPLVFDNDPGKLKLFLQQHYPSVFIDAKDAQLVYNSGLNQFRIVPGTDGRGVNMHAFEASLPEIAANPHDITLKVAMGPAQPLIQPAGLKDVQREANKRIRLNVSFTMDGKQVYKVGADDIANWLHFIPDVVRGKSYLEFDKAKVKQFILRAISPTLAVPPITRKVVTDTKTGEKNVISAGQDGRIIADAETLARNIVLSLTSGQPIEQSITIIPSHFKTVTMSGYGKWIEVDITRETTTLYVGDKPVKTFLISSGRSRTPTEVGEFAIYAKFPLKTMTGTILGEYYYIPNIKWVSFFDGGEAFHGTYWHHNFGHPMSHGCINMTEPDAKILYDFAPIGTKVIVHN